MTLEAVCDTWVPVAWPTVRLPQIDDAEDTALPSTDVKESHIGALSAVSALLFTLLTLHLSLVVPFALDLV